MQELNEPYKLPPGYQKLSTQTKVTMAAARNRYRRLTRFCGGLFVTFLLCSGAAAEGDALVNFGGTFLNACKAFKASRGRLPESESDLVPNHLSDENSVIVHQGKRLKFIFVPKMRYKLNGMNILCVQSRPTIHEEILRSQHLIHEGRLVITVDLKDYFVDEVQFEDIISCRGDKAGSVPLTDPPPSPPASSLPPKPSCPSTPPPPSPTLLSATAPPPGPKPRRAAGPSEGGGLRIEARALADKLNDLYVPLRGPQILEELDETRAAEWFTESLLREWLASKKHLPAARLEVQRTGDKLPFGEGSVFLSVYESGKIGKITSVAQFDDIGIVTFEGEYNEYKDKFILRFVMHSVGGRWRLGDIVDGDGESSLLSALRGFLIASSQSAKGKGAPAGKEEPPDKHRSAPRQPPENRPVKSGSAPK